MSACSSAVSLQLSLPAVSMLVGLPGQCILPCSEVALIQPWILTRCWGLTSPLARPKYEQRTRQRHCAGTQTSVRPRSGHRLQSYSGRLQRRTHSYQGVSVCTAAASSSQVREHLAQAHSMCRYAPEGLAAAHRLVKQGPALCAPHQWPKVLQRGSGRPAGHAPAVCWHVHRQVSTSCCRFAVHVLDGHVHQQLRVHRSGGKLQDYRPDGIMQPPVNPWLREDLKAQPQVNALCAVASSSIRMCLVAHSS